MCGGTAQLSTAQQLGEFPRVPSPYACRATGVTDSLGFARVTAASLPQSDVGRHQLRRGCCFPAMRPSPNARDCQPAQHKQPLAEGASRQAGTQPRKDRKAEQGLKDTRGSARAQLAPLPHCGPDPNCSSKWLLPTSSLKPVSSRWPPLELESMVEGEFTKFKQHWGAHTEVRGWQGKSKLVFQSRHCNAGARTACKCPLHEHTAQVLPAVQHERATLASHETLKGDSLFSTEEVPSLVAHDRPLPRPFGEGLQKQEESFPNFL